MDIAVTPLLNQGLFVKAAMVLLFLGNWRSTLIIALTIPLSILASILVLKRLRETLNIMTLGWPGAVGGHPGGPGHRHHREHRAPPPARCP